MKNFFYLIIPVWFFILLSCDKEDVVATNTIANISFLETSSGIDAQEIKVTIQKASPCQYVSKTVKTVSGNTFNYNIILEGEELRCITIYGIEEIVPIKFDPSTSGEYTLKFLINGKLLETRTVKVNGLEGSWIVESFEDYISSTSITKTDENTWRDFNNGDITVNLWFTSSPQGKISGKNVSNIFEGDFQIKPDNKLVIDNMIWTEQSEPEWGKMFHAIEDAQSYEIKGNRLVIYYNNKENGIVLKRSAK